MLLWLAEWFNCWQSKAFCPLIFFSLADYFIGYLLCFPSLFPSIILLHLEGISSSLGVARKVIQSKGFTDLNPHF